MSAIFELEAELRQDCGKGASRRLRRLQDKVPAIVYGGGQAPTPIMLAHNKVSKASESEAFYSHLLTLTIAGKKQQVILKDLQRHHYKKAISHMDFQRVSATDKISMHVPIHFIGEQQCPGIKAGGLLNKQLIDIEVRCQANNLPEYIEVDISKLELDSAVHMADLKLPEGIESTALMHGNNTSIVSVQTPRKVADEEEKPVTEETAAEASNKDKKEDSKDQKDKK